MLDNPFAEEIIPGIKSKPLLAQFETIYSCPIAWYQGQLVPIVWGFHFNGTLSVLSILQEDPAACQSRAGSSQASGSESWHLLHLKTSSTSWDVFCISRAFFSWVLQQQGWTPNIPSKLSHFLWFCDSLMRLWFPPCISSAVHYPFLV